VNGGENGALRRLVDRMEVYYTARVSVPAIQAAVTIGGVNACGSEARVLGAVVWCTIVKADVLPCAHA